MEELEFLNNCENCGAQCCKNWNPLKFDPSIVNDKGICIYLDTNTNLCTIYNNRPYFCRVYEYYEKELSSKMSLETYLHKTKIGCKALQKMAKRSK